MQSTNDFVPLHERCQYPSKCCPERRAVKDGGDLHRLCEFHRKLANRNQQRLQQRRRMLRERTPSSTSAPRSKLDHLDVSMLAPHDFTASRGAPVSPVDGLAELCLEDLEMLLQLLDNDNSELLRM